MELSSEKSKNTPLQSKFSIAIIGRGNVATHLLRAFTEAGHSVICCGGREREQQIPADADIVIIAVRDDAIQQVARGVATECPGALIVHTAGSVNMDVIPAEHRGVFYPMQTFSKSRDVDFSVIPLFLEASDPEGLGILTTLAHSVSNVVMELDSERRKTLHLAAVLCCNFTNHLYDLTSQVLADKGIPFSTMLPLIDETVNKIHQLSPHQAQTGPAVRWDEKVMEAHLSMIQDESLRTLYRLMSDSIHRQYSE